jgi:hypothetical protein
MTDQQSSKSFNSGPLARRVTGSTIAIILSARLQPCWFLLDLPGRHHVGDLVRCILVHSSETLKSWYGAVASRRIVRKLVGFHIVKSVLNVYKTVLVTVSFVYSTFDTTIPGRYAGAL